MLLLILVYTLSLPLIPALSIVDWKSLETENGIGGPFSEQIAAEPDTEEIDWEIVVVPEPELFFRPRILLYDTYKVIQGDTISAIALSKGLNQDTLLSVNAIKNSRQLQINQILKIPNQDGIYHEVNSSDTLSAIAEKYSVDEEAIKIVNELFGDSTAYKTVLFIPGARMGSTELQEINGDLFMWPVTGYITSPYGYRIDPFEGVRTFHTGIDIGGAYGTVIRAAMSGRVITASYNDTFGNYVVISHHSGYSTLYGHLSSISVKSGAYVVTGERIGLMGSTGKSTGNHLHFTVYKNGVTVNPRTLLR
jgi:murein DD-endopeptidase MepM/ murein hydrolase activator NlpD